MYRRVGRAPTNGISYYYYYKYYFYYYHICFILLVHAPHSVFTQNPAETKASCEDRCSESYFPGMPCYCNEACLQFENCCFDYFRLCNPEAIIPDTWVHYSGHSYKFIEGNTVSAEGGEGMCREEGAMLASINSPEEAEFIYKEVLRLRAMSVFIGGSDRDREGYWRWADGQVMPSPGSEWHMWYKDQPDNGQDEEDQEDCTIITKYRFWTAPRVSLTSFYWADYSCETNPKDVQGFLCERTLQCEPNPCENNATCRFAPQEVRGGGQREYVCDCQQHFYGTHCHRELKPGESWSFCGVMELTAEVGELKSPLYPLDYPPRVDCSYTIKVTKGHTIALRIEGLDIEEGKNCIFDSLTLYDGGTERHPVLRGPLCGKKSFAKVIYSSTNEVAVRFTTDDSVNQAGYKISYSANECGTGSGDSGCGSKKYFTSTCGRILITRGAKEAGQSCEWVIDTPQGYFINLTFIFFNIPHTGMDCSGGSLSLYDGTDAGSPLLGRYCGQQFPWSIQSTGNSLSLRLEGNSWIKDSHLVSLVYDTLDPERWKKSIMEESETTGEINITTSSPMIETDADYTYKWLITGAIGKKLYIEWTINNGEYNASVQVYDGSREDCSMAFDEEVLEGATGNIPLSGTFTSTTFSLLVVVTKAKQDSQFAFSASYREEDWSPLLSGCYRPAYRQYTGSPETENTLVTPLEPVVLSISDRFTTDETPFYEPGLYCKWRISGDVGSKLTVHVVSMNIYPPNAECTSDGLVIYEGGNMTGTKHGPYCGSSGVDVELNAADIMVVFYSSTIPSVRQNGVLRAIVSTSPAPETKCRMDEMGAITTQTFNSSCGIVTSPNFPGRVAPGDWSWVIDSAPVEGGAYFKAYLYYVRGPADKGGTGCSQFFKLYEVPRDSGSFKHYETTYLELCQTTDLFIPESVIKLPPLQKLGIDLSTARSAISQRWEFKLAYTTAFMPTPVDKTKADCADEESVYFRGHCYRIYAWVLRHYPDTVEEYSFAKTWQGSLDYCERKNGTLLTIKDEEEASFIKYTLAHQWFWDKAGTYQTNHRMIFIGLHNKMGHYKWTDGTALAYSDWFWPTSRVYTPPLYPDMDTNTAYLLHNGIPQPTVDSGSLCAVMIPLSPHKSLNWAKVPCDYPFQRTSAICKTPALSYTSAGSPQTEGNLPPNSRGIHHALSASDAYKACPEGWVAVRGKCLSMFSNYALINASLSSSGSTSTSPYLPLTYPEARRACKEKMARGTGEGRTAGTEEKEGKAVEGGRAGEGKTAGAGTGTETGAGAGAGAGGEAGAGETKHDKMISDGKKAEKSTAEEGREGGAEAETESEGIGAAGGLLGFDADMLPMIKNLLMIWNHTEEMGDIWMHGSTPDQCSIIKVRKTHRLDTETQYEHVYTPCPAGGAAHSIYNALCQTQPIEAYESCGSDEHRCTNMACVSVDSVCDGVDDCGDNSDEINCSCGEEYLSCEDGTGCIPVSLYCDFRPQCKDESDEAYCVHDACRQGQFRCHNKECIDEARVCDFTMDCVDGSDEASETCEGRCEGFQCYSGRCLRHSLQQDLVSDCPGLQREDEKATIQRSNLCPLTNTDSESSAPHHPDCQPSDSDSREGASLGLVSDTGGEDQNDTVVFGCSLGTAVQCRAGRESCFERSNTCIYDTSRMSPNVDQVILNGCRTGFHLRTECGDVECPGMYHCPNSYCIPYSMICDGHKQCPLGEDEELCENYVCPGMLRCKGERHCVPHRKVCDGQINCQLDATDEKYCAAKDAACVSGCNCTGNVISCMNAGLTSLPEPLNDVTRSLRALLLSGNKINLTSNTLSHLSWLGRLDLSNNQLRTLGKGLFKDLKNLFDLDLSNNRISAIDDDTFTGLVSLRTLNFHGNQILGFRMETFKKLINLRHLILTDNILKEVSVNAFDALKSLKELNTDAYKFCCIATHVGICTPEADEFSSCEDLMSNYALQVSIWVLGLIAFIGNTFVIIWRLNTDRARVSSFFIINLGISDWLMGIYMLIIASVDVFYRGRYIVYADSWRSSALCKVAGVTSMISSEVSVFMLTAITAERFISFVFPLKANNFRLKHARIIAIVGWVVVIILSLIPTMGIPYFGDSFFGRTGVCLPFHLNTERLPGWEYSIFIFLCLNFVSFIFIIAGYVFIFMVVSRSARGVQSTSALDEYSLAKKLALIVGTDLACWVPIVLIGFAALGGAKIPPQVAAWIAVFVLPLNSAVNPILYTISALDFSKVCCRGKDTKNHSGSNGATSLTTTAGDTKSNTTH